MRTAKTCECPKCGGTGFIRAYSGIANGVCFRCAGKGKFKSSSVPKPKPLTEYQQKMIDIVETGDLESMTFGQLSELRTFSHWHFPAAPHLLSIWKARGEPRFQELQAECVQSLYG